MFNINRKTLEDLLEKVGSQNYQPDSISDVCIKTRTRNINDRYKKSRRGCGIFTSD